MEVCAIPPTPAMAANEVNSGSASGSSLGQPSPLSSETKMFLTPVPSAASVEGTLPNLKKPVNSSTQVCAEEKKTPRKTRKPSTTTIFTVTTAFSELYILPPNSKGISDTTSIAYVSHCSMEASDGSAGLGMRPIQTAATVVATLPI